MTELSPAEAVFYAAAALPAADRAAYLTAACAGRDDLRRRVEDMLAARSAVGDFLEPPSARTVTHGPEERKPPAAGTTRVAGSDTSIGTVLANRYRLIERIGEGGMGQVFLAQQTEPVRRTVAVKVIKAGMDSKAVLARFEAERQALAVMDHPNIAKVFDAGTTDSGRPFFVMELVKGVPITRFCDERKWTPEQRLELFVPVCQAIQHAHQKGVIHRDVKPANVLVALYDDRPVPKVIDFGVAKATGSAVAEDAPGTGYGAVVGTPQYMSPEQATFNNLDVDTRTDVYSLGVLLYELLAGSPPFQPQELERRGLLEILRVVREVEPPKPSDKLSTADALPGLAASRGMEPKKLTGLLRRELDWIVMKALEKDRGRRYETANGFAADVVRYLAGEPVQAHPPTAAYRVRKFARRHRGVVVAGGLVLATLLTGLTATSFGLYKADVERRRAEGAERDAVGNAAAAVESAAAERTANRREVEQRAKAERARDRTAEVLDAMTSAVTGEALATQATVSAEQKKFLSDALAYYRELAGENAVDEPARARTANAALRVGLIEYRLGRKAEAAVATAAGRDAFAALVAQYPGVTEYRRDLALCRNNLGHLLAELGRPAEALEEYRSGLAERQRLADENPTVAARQSDLAASRTNLGVLLAASEKPEEALDQYSKGLGVYDALVVRHPTVPEYRQDRIKVRVNLGALLAGTGESSGALDQFRLALTESKRLATDYPEVTEYSGDLAACHTNLGEFYRELDRREAALTEYRAAVAILEPLASRYPSALDFQIDLGRAYCDVGNLVRDGGHPRDSVDWFNKAVLTLAPIARSSPTDRTTTKFLRNSHAGRAGAHERLDRMADAVADWDRAVELSAAEDRARVRATRLPTYLLAGKTDEAVAEAAELSRSPGWSPNQWYGFAAVYAVASARVEGQKRPYGERAVGLLRTAVRHGYRNTARMNSDPQLDPIRDRDDFKTLLAELQKKFPSKTEVLPPPRKE